MRDTRLIDGTAGNMPPPWRRSLTESAMRRPPTRLDRFVVAFFVLALVALVVAFALYLAEPAAPLF
jgi:type VI protein secretion system component VasF